MLIQKYHFQDNEGALSKRLSGVPLTPPCNADIRVKSVKTAVKAFN